MKKRQTLAQKISVMIAYLCYLAAAGCQIGLYFYYDGEGMNNPISASLMASTVFFIGSGIVLHVMGKTDLPVLKFDNQDKD
jgi:hypothetical protein